MSPEPSGGTTGGDPGGGSPPDDEESGEGKSDPSAPRIIEVSTDLKEIARDQPVTVSVIVTDPDGIDDLIGGQLKTGDGRATYGTFVTTAQEGAYEFTLLFERVAQADPVVEPTPAQRIFRVEFFDQSGGKAVETFELAAICGQDGLLLCEGGCFPGECHPLVHPCRDGETCQRERRGEPFRCWPMTDEPWEYFDGCGVDADCPGGFCNRYSQCSTFCDPAASGSCPVGTCRPYTAGLGNYGACGETFMCDNL